MYFYHSKNCAICIQILLMFIGIDEIDVSDRCQEDEIIMLNAYLNNLFSFICWNLFSKHFLNTSVEHISQLLRVILCNDSEIGNS